MAERGFVVSDMEKHAFFSGKRDFAFGNLPIFLLPDKE